MGVMNQMRDKMSIILGIVIVAFLATIFFSWGMGVNGPRSQKNVIAEVNGTEITLEQYMSALNQQMSYYRDQTGQELDAMTRIRLQDQVYENMVQDVLIQQEIEKLGLEATDEEVYFYLENNPPEYIRQAEIFQTDSLFDHQKYLNILRDPSNPYGINWVPIEEEIRRILPYEKLNEHLVSTVIVTDEEVRQAYGDETVRYDIEYLTVTSNKIPNDTIQISDEEIQDFYNQNREDYKIPETKILQYVSWSKVPSSEDTLLVRKEIDEILLRLEEGESFENLARIFSQDPSASEGGSLGYIKKGEMVKPFEDAAFNAPLNKVIGPVETRFGFHLIRVDDRKVENGEPQVKVSHILLKVDVGPNTLDNLASEARIFAFDAEDQGFEKALNYYKLKADTTQLGVTEDNYYYPGLGFVPDLTRWAFRNKAGAITEQPFETQDKIIVAQIIEEKPESYQSLSELKPTLERQLRQEKKDELSRHIALELAKTGKNLYELKDENPLTDFGREEAITLKNPPAQFRNNPVFQDLVRMADLNEIVGPVKTSRGYALIQVMKKSAFDDKGFRVQQESIRQRLWREKETVVIEAFLSKLKEEAEIHDYRNKYF
ncbi:MAG: peptidyl-prolyl cis-trans isomerase [Candidatus Marinimicrobia bacterium]|jgi:peptidyl-prolyl cis-trans isomerase D|nr:peptidyl-prolyl cis-trans isomerase [Candidatus Neomarinimicrobiota bacterium]